MTDVDVRSPGSGDSAEHKRKHIVWNEENLSYNEANKSVRRGATPPNPGEFHPSIAPSSLAFSRDAEMRSARRRRQ